MRSLFSNRVSGARLRLLVVTAAAFLLLPAAHAAAEGELSATLAGTGEGEAYSDTAGEGAGTPKLECSNIGGGAPGPECGPNEMTEDSEGNFREIVHARPAKGSEFSGWTVSASLNFAQPTFQSCAERPDLPCLLVAFPPTDTEAEAEFTLRNLVTIEGAGEGSGTITSVNQIGEPLDCHITEGMPDEADVEEEKCEVTAGTFPGDPNLEVVITPDPGSEYVECSYAGEGLSGCALGENEANPAEVAFFGNGEEGTMTLTLGLAHPLTLTTSGSGSGEFECSVDSGAAAPCESGDEFPEGSEVEVIPVAGTGSEFVDFNAENGGECSGSECTVEMTGPRSVNAKYDLETFAFTTEAIGEGTVECDSGGGLGACAAEYDYGTVVEVVAEPNSGEFVLAAISGTGSASGCTESPCSFEVKENSSVTAEFKEKFALNLTTSGTGSGSFECEVNGGPAEACAAEYVEGDEVTVIANADIGSELGNVSGTGSAAACAASPCTVTMTEDGSIDAELNLIDRTLTINQGGTGSGVVECEVAGSEVEEACQPTYPHGTEVIVIAYADLNSEFTEWSGDCDEVIGIECELTMDEDKTVEVVFDLEQRSLTVNTAGSGSGSVSCNGGACAAGYPHGTELTLAATAASGSTFAGWSGGGCSGTGNCVVMLEADTEVTATFDAEPTPRLLPRRPFRRPPPPHQPA